MKINRFGDRIRYQHIGNANPIKYQKINRDGRNIQVLSWITELLKNLNSKIYTMQNSLVKRKKPTLYML